MKYIFRISSFISHSFIFFVKLLLKAKKGIVRDCNKTNWYNLRSFKPISTKSGFDRGTPIDRFYIETFLEENKSCIGGVVCEIGDNKYTKKYSHNLKKSEVFHYTHNNRKATIIGDLADVKKLPQNSIDCFILTHTLNHIYDFTSAIKGVYYMIRDSGCVLATVPFITQVSEYDKKRWGDYWRFGDIAIRKSFEDVFGKENVEVKAFGNLLASTAILHGISAEELTSEELLYYDEIYPVIIAIKALKK